MKKINELINILVDGLTKEEITLNCESMKQLLDYITNLQEENEEYQQRIDIATGIANERINYCYHENDKEQLESWEEIFDILQGIDENE